MVLVAAVPVPRGQVRPGVVTALVVVVLDVEADQLAEVDPQGAAGVVDVLTVQRLGGEGTLTSGLHTLANAKDDANGNLLAWC